MLLYGDTMKEKAEELISKSNLGFHPPSASNFIDYQLQKLEQKGIRENWFAQYCHHKIAMETIGYEKDD